MYLSLSLTGNVVQWLEVGRKKRNKILKIILFLCWFLRNTSFDFEVGNHVESTSAKFWDIV